MAKKQNGVNRSEEIRQIFKTDPEIKVKEVVAVLAERGITVSDNLVYLVKGKIEGRKARKKKAQKIVAKVAEATGAPKSDVLTTILKVKNLAAEVGGLKKLKALVEVLVD